MISIGLTRKTALNAVALFDKFGSQTVFGRNDVVDTLGLSPSASSDLLKRLSTAHIIEPVNGLGKGKYRFDPRNL